jgi:hypothetical protein
MLLKARVSEGLIAQIVDEWIYLDQMKEVAAE